MLPAPAAGMCRPQLGDLTLFVGTFPNGHSRTLRDRLTSLYAQQCGEYLQGGRGNWAASLNRRMDIKPISRVSACRHSGSWRSRYQMPKFPGQHWSSRQSCILMWMCLLLRLTVDELFPSLSLSLSLSGAHLYTAHTLLMMLSLPTSQLRRGELIGK